MAYADTRGVTGARKRATNQTSSVAGMSSSISDGWSITVTPSISQVQVRPRGNQLHPASPKTDVPGESSQPIESPNSTCSTTIEPIHATTSTDQGRNRRRGSRTARIPLPSHRLLVDASSSVMTSMAPEYQSGLSTLTAAYATEASTPEPFSLGIVQRAGRYAADAVSFSAA